MQINHRNLVNSVVIYKSSINSSEMLKSSIYFLFKNTKIVSLSIFTSLLFLTSCGNRETLLGKITEFNNSVQVGTDAIAAYYSSINEQEINTYTLILELNPNCEAGDFINYKCLDSNFKPPGKKEDFFISPLKQPSVPLESIQTRISLLKELADYSKSIASFASDTPAEKFQGNIKTLQSRLVSLEQKFQVLQNKTGSSKSPDSTISERYINPITNIIGILGKIALQESRWSTIRKSIIEAEGSVDTVLKAIGDDLDTYALPLISVEANARYSLLINYYNKNRLRFNQRERSLIITQILDYKKVYNLAAINKPSVISKDLSEAHKKLVNLAKSDGSVKDIAELNAWLDKFKDDAGQFKEAIDQLSQIQRGK